METAITVAMTLLTIGVCFIAWQAHLWRQRALKLQAFVENPNVQQHDKEADYKASYEAKLNALSDERRKQLEAMNEVFDFLNDNGPFEDRVNAGLMQCRNVLLTAIADSTYGRE